MKKSLTFFALLSLAPIIGGLYGIMHDQITYTISPKYYTKFKFYQFGFMDIGNEAIFPNPRFQVSIVGFLATWWMGVPIGLILGLFGLGIQDNKKMFSTTMKGFAITMIVAFLTGLLGLIYGKMYLVDTEVNWWFPESLIDKASFIAVGSMHNFSYIGGLAGLIAGIIYIVKQKNKINLNPTN